MRPKLLVNSLYGDSGLGLAPLSAQAPADYVDSSELELLSTSISHLAAILYLHETSTSYASVLFPKLILFHIDNYHR